MRLPATGREYAHATLTGLPEDVVLEVSLDGDTWLPLARDGETVQVLVAGPDVTDNPAGTLVLPTGRTMLTVRAVDNPEIVVRTWGPFDVA